MVGTFAHINRTSLGNQSTRSVTCTGVSRPSAENRCNCICAHSRDPESVYPFSFLQIHPLKCRYQYCVHKEDLAGMETHLEAMHGWLGSMTVCCTPMVRLGKWQVDFHRPEAGDPEINIDQSKNLLEVERGNDLLAALCIAYAFDKALCQPLVTIIGYQEKEHPDDDDDSLESYEPEVQKTTHVLGNQPDVNDEEFEPAGYLGYEDPESQDIEVGPNSGYFETNEHTDFPDGHSEEVGYYNDGKRQGQYAADDTYVDEP